MAHEAKWVDLTSDARGAIEQQCQCGCERKRARADSRDDEGWRETFPPQRVTDGMARVVAKPGQTATAETPKVG